jgi:MFS family permease
MQRKQAGLGVIWLTVFIDLVGFSILFPLFADLVKYFGDDALLKPVVTWLDGLLPAGGTATERAARVAALVGGMLLGLYSVLQFICAPLWGRLSDRIGRRRVLLVTVTGTLLGYLLWIVADSFLLLVVSRALCGVMAGNISVATAAVGDITTAENRTRGMGFIGMAFGLGFILGPVIGAFSAGMVGEGMKPSEGLAWNPFSIAACISAGLAALNLFWVVTRFGETLPPDQRRQQAEPPAVLGKPVVSLCRANLFYIIAFAGMEATLVFLLSDKLSYTPGWMGLVFTVLGLVSAGIQGGLVRRLVPKLGPQRLAILGLAIMLPAYVLLGSIHFLSSSWPLWLGIVLLGAGIGFTMPSLAGMVSLLADRRSQGAAMGRFRGAGALGRAIGPFVGAGLYFWLGPSGPYFIGAVLLLAPLFMLAALRMTDPPAASVGPAA